MKGNTWSWVQVEWRNEESRWKNSFPYEGKMLPALEEANLNAFTMQYMCVEVSVVQDSLQNTCSSMLSTFHLTLLYGKGLTCSRSKRYARLLHTPLLGSTYGGKIYDNALKGRPISNRVNIFVTSSKVQSRCDASCCRGKRSTVGIEL